MWCECVVEVCGVGVCVGDGAVWQGCVVKFCGGDRVLWSWGVWWSASVVGGIVLW